MMLNFFLVTEKRSATFDITKRTGNILRYEFVFSVNARLYFPLPP